MSGIFSRWTALCVVIGLSVAGGCTLLRRSALNVPRNLPPNQRDLYLADAYVKVGNWEAAGPIFARLEQRFRASGDRRNELYSHVGRLRAEEEYSDLQRLSDELRQILQRPEVQNDLALKQRVLEVNGNVDLNLDGVSSRSSFEQLERVAAQRHDKAAESRASGELGIVAFLEGNQSEAKRRVLWAIATAYAVGDAGAKIRYWSLLGQGMVENSQAETALSHLDRAISIAKSTPGAGFPKIAMVGKASALMQLHRYRESSEVIEEGLRYGRQHGYLGYEVDMLAQKGDLAARQNDIPLAIGSLEEAAALAKQIHFNRGAAEVNAQLAALYKRAGDLPKAEFAAQRSVEAHRAIQEIYEIPHHLAVEAAIQKAMGDMSVARQTLETAEQVVSTMLQNAPTVAVKRGVVASMSEVFEQHFDLEVQSNNLARAYDVIEKARGRVAADRLRAGETKSRSMPRIAADERRLASLQLRLLDATSQQERTAISDAVTEAQDKLGEGMNGPLIPPVGAPPSLRDLQRALRPNEVVLEYVLGDEASYCLAVRRDAATVARLANRKAIDDLTERYLEAVKGMRPAKSEAVRLYSAILQPIPEIAGAPEIIVIPDGSLHRVPFGALRDPATGRYLLETRVLSYAPSGAVLTLLRNRSHPEREQLLAVGGVAYGKDPAQPARRGFPWLLFRGLDALRRDQLNSLPGTEEEVREVRSALRDVGGVVLSGDKATEPNFKREAAKEFTVVHLAVHAFADKDHPDRAALVFARDASSGEDGLLQVREIRELPMSHTSLVTLSACDTSAGRIEGEEGVSSIVYAFLYAGARSAIASYWVLDDSTTSELMKTFYSELERGSTEAAAMRTAQLTLLRRGGETAVPFYWAAFDVMGDGSTTLRKAPVHDN